MIFYNNISEIPLHNWEQMNLSGDLSWLLTDRTKKFDQEEAMNIYFELNDQAAPHTGAKELIQEFRSLAFMKYDYILQYLAGNKAAMNWIRKIEGMIKALFGDSKDVDIIKTRMIIQKLWGQPINAKQTSYLEFLKIKQLVEEQSSKLDNNGETG